MKKIYSVLLLVTILTMVTFCVNVVSAAPEDGVSLGPIEESGDGEPGDNYFIQPDTPGMGPAPNAGSGDQDGSGF